VNFQPVEVASGDRAYHIAYEVSGGGSEEVVSCVFLGRAKKVSQQREHGEYGNGKKLALFIDSTHFAGAFCLKKPFFEYTTR